MDQTGPEASADGAQQPQVTLEHLTGRYRRDSKFDAGKIFDDCDPKAQRDLFLELWEEFKINRRYPTADKGVFSHKAILSTGRKPGGDGNSEKLDDDKRRKMPVIDPDSGEVKILLADAYMVKDHFRKQWMSGNTDSGGIFTSLMDERESEGRSSKRKKKIDWHSSEVYRTPNGFAYDDDDDPVPPRIFIPNYCSPTRTISSQLLLYRLIATFGMPPSSEKDNIDDYKMTWSYHLYWVADQSGKKMGRDSKSFLSFADWKGSYVVSFQGSEEASKSALKLYEWLVSDNVPHSYDYVVAGSFG